MSRKLMGIVLATVLLSSPTYAGDGLINRSKLVPLDAAASKIVSKPVFLASWKGGNLECSEDRLSCTVRNMPLLAQADPALDSDIKEMGLVGCYDTSILTVILTALANRDPSFVPHGRTKVLMSVPASRSASKEIEQLSQEYRWAKAGQNKETVNGKIVQPLYLHEVVANFDTIVEPCDPLTYGNCGAASNMAGRAFRTWANGNSITNKSVIDLMRKGYVLLIGFERYLPKKTNTGFSFENIGHHKVVISGFQPGKYPLLINDVGSGVRKRARLTTDLASHPFASQIGLSAGRFAYPLATKTFLEYEGSADPQVQFLVQLDGLKLVTPDGLLAEKAAIDMLHAAGCHPFLGRIGDYFCTSAAQPICEVYIAEGKAQVCRRRN